MKDIAIGSTVKYSTSFIEREARFNAFSKQKKQSFSLLTGTVTQQVEDDVYTVVWDLSKNLPSLSYLKKNPTKSLVGYDPNSDTMTIDECTRYLELV